MFFFIKKLPENTFSCSRDFRSTVTGPFNYYIKQFGPILRPLPLQKLRIRLSCNPNFASLTPEVTHWGHSLRLELTEIGSVILVGNFI